MTAAATTTVTVTATAAAAAVAVAMDVAVTAESSRRHGRGSRWRSRGVAARLGPRPTGARAALSRTAGRATPRAASGAARATPAARSGRWRRAHLMLRRRRRPKRGGRPHVVALFALQEGRLRVLVAVGEASRPSQHHAWAAWWAARRRAVAQRRAAAQRRRVARRRSGGGWRSSGGRHGGGLRGSAALGLVLVVALDIGWHLAEHLRTHLRERWQRIPLARRRAARGGRADAATERAAPARHGRMWRQAGRRQAGR